VASAGAGYSDCSVTDVLLGAKAPPRHADAIEVIGAALLAKVAGQGHRAIAADFGNTV
jgi:hypothetical protein